MPEPQKRPAGAVDMTASDLVALAQNPAAFDKLIKEIVAARESAHDRERRAVTAEASLEAEKTALAAAPRSAAAPCHPSRGGWRALMARGQFAHPVMNWAMCKGHLSPNPKASPQNEPPL
jgi:hypothetical protein